MKIKSIIENAIRASIKGAIKLGEMTTRDERYLLEVLAPGAADIAASRVERAARRHRGGRTNPTHELIEGIYAKALTSSDAGLLELATTLRERHAHETTDPKPSGEGKEWCIFVWDSVNDMGECAHGKRSAAENLHAILDEMEDGDVVEMKIRRKDMTPAELAALPTL